MEYTIKRDGKTYQEYKDFIVEEVELLDLKAGDKVSLIAKRYKENDKWFEQNQKKFDIEDRIKKLKDLDMALALSEIEIKNKALVIKKILDGDEGLLTSLESVGDKVDEFYQKQKEKNDKINAIKNRKKEIKEWLKSKDIDDLNAQDIKQAVIFLMRNILDEQDN